MNEQTTIEYIVNVEVAIWRGEKWMLIERGAEEEHASGLMSLVGGKVEEVGASEDVVESTALREVTEEVDLKLSGPLHYVGSSSFVLPGGAVVVDLVFASPIDADAVPRCVDEHEVAAIVWLSAAEAEASTVVPPWTKRSIALAEKVRCQTIANAAS